MTSTEEKLEAEVKQLKNEVTALQHDARIKELETRVGNSTTKLSETENKFAEKLDDFKMYTVLSLILPILMIFFFLVFIRDYQLEKLKRTGEIPISLRNSHTIWRIVFILGTLVEIYFFIVVFTDSAIY